MTDRNRDRERVKALSDVNAAIKGDMYQEFMRVSELLDRARAQLNRGHHKAARKSLGGVVSEAKALTAAIAESVGETQ